MIIYSLFKRVLENFVLIFSKTEKLHMCTFSRQLLDLSHEITSIRNILQCGSANFYSMFCCYGYYCKLTRADNGTCQPLPPNLGFDKMPQQVVLTKYSKVIITHLNIFIQMWPFPTNSSKNINVPI